MELAALAFLISCLIFWSSWTRFLIATRKNWAIEDAHREGTEKLLREFSARVDEGVALQKQALKQGVETIALLNAIKDNLEHRSTKN